MTEVLSYIWWTTIGMTDGTLSQKQMTANSIEIIMAIFLSGRNCGLHDPKMANFQTFSRIAYLTSQKLHYFWNCYT